jgi:hypothetical protein
MRLSRKKGKRCGIHKIRKKNNAFWGILGKELKSLKGKIKYFRGK